MQTRLNFSQDDAGLISSEQKNFCFLFSSFVFVAINWHIVAFHFGVDGAARIPFLWGIICLFLSFRKNFGNKTLIFWWCWCFYAFFNALCCGVNTNAFPTLFNLAEQIFMPVLIMTAAMNYTENTSPRKMLVLMFVTMLVCSATLCLRSGMLEDFSLTERMISGIDAEKVNANELGIYLSLLLTLGLILYESIGKKKPFLLLIFMGSVILLIFRTASRTSFVITVLGLIFTVLLQGGKMFRKSLPYAIVVGVVIFWILPPIEDVVVFERFQNTAEQMEKQYFADTFIAKMMGDRATYYYGGWDIFKKYPSHGVGFANYIFFNPTSDHVCHVEVMSQLSEEGIWGTLLFVLFYGSIFHSFYKTKKHASAPEWKNSLILFIQICAINFASYTSSRIVYYMILGYILGNMRLYDRLCESVVEKKAS